MQQQRTLQDIVSVQETSGKVNFARTSKGCKPVADEVLDEQVVQSTFRPRLSLFWQCRAIFSQLPVLAMGGRDRALG